MFKSGNRNNIKNYRPLTVINNFTKVFEIVLYLSSITQHISNAIDTNIQVDVICTDLSVIRETDRFL